MLNRGWCGVCLIGFTSKKVYLEGWVTEVNNKDKTKEMLKLSIVNTKHTGWGMGYMGRVRISIRIQRMEEYESSGNKCICLYLVEKDTCMRFRKGWAI